ncbi:hypothetical protein J6590_071745 [Homalodisca vitripennis]|nr:hypothetical protein J6590_071745 [Homalodisca vitripennis]
MINCFNVVSGKVEDVENWRGQSLRSSSDTKCLCLEDVTDWEIMSFHRLWTQNNYHISKECRVPKANKLKYRYSNSDAYWNCDLYYDMSTLPVYPCGIDLRWICTEMPNQYNGSKVPKPLKELDGDHEIKLEELECGNLSSDEE